MLWISLSSSLLSTPIPGPATRPLASWQEEGRRKSSLTTVEYNMFIDSKQSSPHRIRILAKSVQRYESLKQEYIDKVLA